MHCEECVAMILAGGQGSRLGVLTKSLAKPAVPFGGKYRLIDFTLSNCTNSGITTVGVLTQYQPLELHKYIGIGSHWDLDRNKGGVFILPPFVHAEGGKWYEGTAHSIYQNIGFIDQFSPAYVLILSGDHIYQMDYSLMLDYHKETKADATIAVIHVPEKEASRFGIMNTSPDGRIIEFEEKPKQPKNNLASMGVYIFTWDVLKAYLEKDDKNAASNHDFGKNLIPAMLQDGQKMMAYLFKGYWKDVGTVESLWEANMDLLSENPGLNLYNPAWRIYSMNPPQPPQLVTDTGKVTSSLVSVGCLIHGEVKDSVLFPGVYVAPGAVVEDSVVFPNVKIGRNVRIDKAIIGSHAVIEEGCQIGQGEELPLDLKQITVLGERVTIPNDTVITQGSVVQQMVSLGVTA